MKDGKWVLQGEEKLLIEVRGGNNNIDVTLTKDMGSRGFPKAILCMDRWKNGEGRIFLREGDSAVLQLYKSTFLGMRHPRIKPRTLGC